MIGASKGVFELPAAVEDARRTLELDAALAEAAVEGKEDRGAAGWESPPAAAGAGAGAPVLEALAGS